MMPIYDYRCPRCGWVGENVVPMFDRDGQLCPHCDAHVDRLLSAPAGRVTGRIPQGGGPDRFTADALGIPLKELPEALRTGS
jgi:putative FmdB family regulatory protein